MIGEIESDRLHETIRDILDGKRSYPPGYDESDVLGIIIRGSPNEFNAERFRDFQKAVCAETGIALVVIGGVPGCIRLFLRIVTRGKGDESIGGEIEASVDCSPEILTQLTKVLDDALQHQPDLLRFAILAGVAIVQFQDKSIFFPSAISDTNEGGNAILTINCDPYNGARDISIKEHHASGSTSSMDDNSSVYNTHTSNVLQSAPLEAPIELAPEALVSLSAARREASLDAADAPKVPQAEPVDAAVFCPPTIGRASSFIVQVFLYPPTQPEVAYGQARAADYTAERRGALSLQLDIPRGTRIDLRLEMDGLLVDESDAMLIWRGATTAAQFDVAVPADVSLGPAIGRIRFSIAGVPAGTLRFQVTVAAAATSEVAKAAEIAIRRYHRAFVSYASEDCGEVLRRVQAFRIAGLSIFQDLLSLDPGARWERELYREIDNCDVMLLFWSHAAAASPWVAKEIDYALARNHGQDDLPPDIRPVPIEDPIPPPPDKLRHLHFNDALLAHIAAASRL